jgi:hypothetical protein
MFHRGSCPTPWWTEYNAREVFAKLDATKSISTFREFSKRGSFSLGQKRRSDAERTALGERHEREFFRSTGAMKEGRFQDSRVIEV